MELPKKSLYSRLQIQHYVLYCSYLLHHRIHNLLPISRAVPAKYRTQPFLDFLFTLLFRVSSIIIIPNECWCCVNVQCLFFYIIEIKSCECSVLILQLCSVTWLCYYQYKCSLHRKRIQCHSSYMLLCLSTRMRSHRFRTVADNWH